MGEKSLDIRRASAAEAAGALSLDALAGMGAELGAERWRAVSDAAQVVANYLVCHPRVEAVRYPGLRSDPDFERAAGRLVGGFGPRVALRVSGAPAGEWLVWEADARDARDQVMGLEEFIE